ncbi:MAG: hypothetical protein GX113_07515 [Actinobacteria bacterium]|jgi:hypothetical protein|nr:hypothetical protein [Actinomycetota bacterium]
MSADILVDLSAALTIAPVGLITGFERSKASQTGFRVSMLLRGIERTFDAVESAYQLQFSDAYFPYPPIGERLFLAHVDDRGTITGLDDVNNFLQAGNPITTACMLGTYKMFEVKITESTPLIGDLLRVEPGRVVFTAFDRHSAAGAVAHCSHGGKFPAPADGLSFELAEETVVYTWDWTTSLAPFSCCTRDEARARRFTTRAYPGSLDDLGKNCYWAGFYSTRGNEDECDLVKCFLNRPPGWE